MPAGIAYATLTPTELARRWNELQRDPSAPDFCELDEYGDVIVMNPPRKPHQRIVRALMHQIETRLGGEALPGLGVLTRIGVRVPDIVWQPQPTDDDPASPAPPLIVEVQSDANTRAELDAKVAAYLAAGAREVILVELSGRIRYFGAEGERTASAYGLTLALPAGTYPPGG
ncbi:MAG TPA: Uma2 family endonuclease [Burkholderiaceae bacterium]|nr:Uma2 family endonuclease [Burkholderiaceae bacterium]